MIRINQAAAVASIVLATGYFYPSPASAIVNGVDASNAEFGAVVSVGGCTGTFVHPRFIITAAHCLPKCTSAKPNGCITGTAQDLVDGVATGRDGPITTLTARDGIAKGTGAAYEVNYVYFAKAADLGRSRAPDVALLRTAVPFTGTIIPVLTHQDRPRPDEGNYCPRWEYTWPWILGYSDNAGTTTARRRIGRAFAECDLEMDQTTFKLDGHGRSGQRGIRTCKGDSGGPVLWQTGFGGYGVGGINSATDDYKVITDTQCPSERGEGYEAFIPSALLDRVAGIDALCRRSGSWQSCLDLAGVPLPYAGMEVQYLGTEIDQCGASALSIDSTNGSITVGRGATAAAKLAGNVFSWTCGGSHEETTAREGTGLTIAKRGLTDSQVIWDTYSVIQPPAVQSSWIIPILSLMQ